MQPWKSYMILQMKAIPFNLTFYDFCISTLIQKLKFLYLQLCGLCFLVLWSQLSNTASHKYFQSLGCEYISQCSECSHSPPLPHTIGKRIRWPRAGNIHVILKIRWPKSSYRSKVPMKHWHLFYLQRVKEREVQSTEGQIKDITQTLPIHTSQIYAHLHLKFKYT